MLPPSHHGKDFYKILNVSKTATTHEIKQAYRKLAMALHPDRNEGCPQKAAVFKQASEAYTILSNHQERTQYDSIVGNTLPRRKPPPNYRKVYSPRAPKGFKTFDSQRHWDYHYGDGMMRDEVERARRRAESASSRNSGYHYESPLGKGFTFTSEQDHNPYSKRAKQGPRANVSGEEDLEYEEAHYYDLGSTDMNNARRVVSRQEYIRQRMYERRKNRVERKQPHEEEATGCTVM